MVSFILLDKPLITAKRLDASVIGSFCFFGKETPRYAFIMIPVMRHALAAFPMPRAVICTRTRSVIVTTRHNSFLL